MSTPNATLAELTRKIAELEKANAELKAQKAQAAQKAFSLSVSSKGAISAYGLGRFPTTLYVAQWKALIANVDTIKAFIAEAEKLGAVATSKDVPFVQPNNLPLKFRAKAAAAVKDAEAL